MCSKCNSGYKLQKDPILGNQTVAEERLSTATPTHSPKLSVAMTIKTKNAQDIQPEEINSPSPLQAKAKRSNRGKKFLGLRSDTRPDAAHRMKAKLG